MKQPVGTRLMKTSRKYRISIDDESRLRRVASVAGAPWILWSLAACALLCSLIVAAIIVMVTPLRTLLPGYLKKVERTATEEGLMRIDSIREAYEANNRYLANMLAVIDTDRSPSTDSATNKSAANELPPDSLLPASPREIQYISSLKDREKYNITVLAPLAAEQLRIYPVGDGAVIAEQSKGASKAKILTPKGSPVCAIADGRVLAIQNPAPEGGAAVVMQHDHGFATRYSHLTNVCVRTGDHIDGGSPLALGSKGGALKPGWIILEMWHDGTPLSPSRYLPGSDMPETRTLDGNTTRYAP